MTKLRNTMAALALAGTATVFGAGVANAGVTEPTRDTYYSTRICQGHTHLGMSGSTFIATTSGSYYCADEYTSVDYFDGSNHEQYTTVWGYGSQSAASVGLQSWQYNHVVYVVGNVQEAASGGNGPWAAGTTIRY